VNLGGCDPQRGPHRGHRQRQPRPLILLPGLARSAVVPAGRALYGRCVNVNGIGRHSELRCGADLEVICRP
jgi:hypothetical protein